MQTVVARREHFCDCNLTGGSSQRRPAPQPLISKGKAARYGGAATLEHSEFIDF
jgi:hypothetical protein